MTLSKTISKIQYDGDGTTVAFPTTFVFWDDDDLQVIHTSAAGSDTIWDRGTHYIVTGGNAAEGTVVVATSPTDYTPLSGEKLTIVSNISDTQPTSLPPGGPFPSPVIELRFDQIVRLVQQRAEELGRAVKLKISSAFSELTIPDPDASKFLRWNAAANALENADVVGQGSIGIPIAIAQGGTEATTAAGARAAIGAQADLDVPSQAEAEAGMATDERVWTAQRVAQAALAHSHTTGDVKVTFKTAADAGWVMMDDGTIGNASSGASNRANADTENLFTLLWNNLADAQAPVSSGRGASAAADFAANKTITLPLVLGRALGVAGAGASLTSRVLGLTTGAETHSLTAAENGPHDHTVTTFNISASGQATGGPDAGQTNATTSSSGSGTAHNNMQPTSFLNVIIKL